MLEVHCFWRKNKSQKPSPSRRQREIHQIKIQNRILLLQIKSLFRKRKADPEKKGEVQKYIINKKEKKDNIPTIFSLIFSLFYIVRGEKFWLVLHENYWGLFGFLGFMIPVLNVYAVNYMLKKKSSYRLIFRLILFCVTIIMFATTIFSFSLNGDRIG